MNRIARAAFLLSIALGFSACKDPVGKAGSDASPPTAGSAITFAGTSATATSVSWGAASDDVTPQSSLQYKLVMASSGAAIAEVDAANAVSGAGLVLDWSENALSANATSLSQGTTYWFAVVVRDGAGNMGVYAPRSVATAVSADTTPPATGSGLSFSGVSAQAMTVSWGAASDETTSRSQLRYKLVKGASVQAIETVQGANAATGADILMPWTTGATSASVTGLTAGTTYYFTVLAQDEAGNMSVYAVATQATSASADSVPPTPGSAIAFSGTSSSTTTASWGPATDNVTAAANLQYRLVRAATAEAIDTVEEANAVTGIDLAMDWTANATTSSPTGLNAATTYYFAVLVRDAASNEALYAPMAVTTTAAPDGTAPTVGAAISFSATTSSGTTVGWGAATDNLTPPAGLRYKLVRAGDAASIDTIEEADAVSGPGLAMDWTLNVSTMAVGSLSASTSYSFAVLVRDAAGNMALYTPKTVTTAAPGNLAFDLNTNPGWMASGDWRWGSVAYDDGNGRYPTGSVCYGTGLAGPYSSNRTYATNYLQAGPFDFSPYASASGFRMNFQAWFFVEFGSDFAALLYSTDGVAFSKVPSARVSGTAYSTGLSETDIWSPNWSDAGTKPAWRNVTIDLGGLGLNGASTVYFRWALSSNGSVQKGGFFVDNIDIGY